MPTYVEYLNAAAGLLGLLLAAITLARVQAVSRAQRDERARIRSLYRTEAAASQLRGAAAYLSGIRDVRARELAQDIVGICGQIEGVSRALDTGPGGSGGAVGQSTVRIRDHGYFSQQFLIDAVDHANRSIDILMYRPLIVATSSVLDRVRAAAKRGVRIRILALSPSCSDEVLTYGATLMPAAAVYRPEQLRPQLIEAERRFTEHAMKWPVNARNRIEYRRYKIAPGPHFIRTDSTITYGFVGLLSGAMPTRFDERAYVELASHTRVGEQVMAHFDQVWRDAEAFESGLPADS